MLGMLCVFPLANGEVDLGADRLVAEERIFGLGKTVFEEDFDRAEGARYWVEGNSEQVWVENGRLVLDGNVAGSLVVTAFIDREFEGDLCFSYEAEVLASDTAKGYPEPRDVNNLNAFIHYSDPEGRPLKETRGERADGGYRHYHELNGYIVTFLNGHMAKTREEPETVMERNTGRIRMRENPGFVLRKEAFQEQSVAGRRYLLQFIYYQGELLFFIDGEYQLGFRASEDRRFDKGHFAFRTYATKMAVDNFEVREIDSVSAAIREK